jgi:hypothetical protein
MLMGISVVQGVSASGALRLQQDTGVHELHSAEVSVRPQAG